MGTGRLTIVKVECPSCGHRNSFYLSGLTNGTAVACSKCTASLGNWRSVMAASGRVARPDPDPAHPFDAGFGTAAQGS